TVGNRAAVRALHRAGGRRAATLVGDTGAAAGLGRGAVSAIEHLAAAIRNLTALRSQGRAGLGYAGRRSALIRRASAADRRRRARSAVEHAAAPVGQHAAGRALGLAGGGLASTFVGSRRPARRAGRPAGATVDHMPAPIGDHAALGADLGAGDRRATAYLRNTTAAAGLRYVAAPATHRPP